MMPFTLSALILLFSFTALAGDSSKNTEVLQDANTRLNAICKFDPICLKAWKENGGYNPAKDLKAEEDRQKQLDKATDDGE